MEQALSPGVARYVKQAEEARARRAEHRRRVRGLKFDTLCVHGMYGLEECFSGGQGGLIEPIFTSTSQAYRDSDEMEAALGYLIPTWCYSRIHNPTVYYLEETLSLIESYGFSGDATALCTSSGMAAIKQAVEPLIAKSREGHEEINFVSSAQVYGGTFQLFNLRMRERGALVRWVTEPWDIECWRPLVDENTRFIYAEIPSNPQQACCDLDRVSELAHKFGIPLVVDSTIATPALLRPLQHGADIVIHSLTKTVGSGGATIGGAVVARHDLTSKHLAPEVRADYATWLKLWPFRDSGPCMSPYSAFFLLNDLRTLRSRVEKMSGAALEVAKFLTSHPKVERVNYLGLPSDPLHPLASKCMMLVDTEMSAFGHLLSFVIRGTAANARTFFDGLSMIYRATDLGRIKSVATIPSISTHQQQGEEGRKLAGIPPTMVRLCVGGEDPADIISDLDQALNKI